LLTPPRHPWRAHVVCRLLCRQTRIHSASKRK
jgi:hypothetical protein